MEAEVLRLGHRAHRDARVSTHIGLVARALGASKLHYSGQKDDSLEKSINDITSRWGGDFEADYVKNWKEFAKEFDGLKVHLTMYGELVQTKISEMNGKKVLIILGGQKVPGEVYDIADYNIAVTGQPHSEIAALAVFLDRHSRGKALETEFPDANISVKPSERGKDIVKK
ncbi:TPA: tRNA (cytidine(56)-2'-O)-methyltransferase [archaeon]|nr:tRNA (cytidine(56)-2'-O)-methyltransferase [Candidatus Undinarchaeales archaeon SRR5007147.bin71]